MTTGGSPTAGDLARGSGDACELAAAAPRACPLCAGETLRTLFVRDGIPYRRCACGFAFTDPGTDVPTTAYDASYYDPWELWEGDRSPARIAKTASFQRWLDRIERHVPERGSLLDVGCANGIFLQAAAARGWHVCGVEVSAFAAEQARRVFGDEVHWGTLETTGFAPGRFDAVTAFDVIEHIPDPRAFVSEAYRVLRPRGLLALVTPDTASWSHGLLGRHWHQYKAEHCSYFSRALLARMLSRQGFEVLEQTMAGKRLTLAFLRAYSQRYLPAAIGKAATLLCRAAPEGLRHRPFPLPTGEMLLIARRDDQPPPTFRERAERA